MNGAFGRAGLLLAWIVLGAIVPTSTRALPLLTTVRLRLFTANPPAKLRVVRAAGVSDELRTDGSRLTLNGKPASPPYRTRGPLTLEADGQDSVHIDGDLEVQARGGALVAVAAYKFEDYVAGVVAGEASVFRSDESLKAMAVAARTYAAHFISRHKDEGFDFCDSTHCQNFHRGATTARIRRAAQDTSGETLLHGGAPIPAYHHRDCGGVTEAKASYLPQLQDSYCASSGAHRWNATLTRAELQSVFSLSAVENIAVAERSSSGRALRVRIDGPRKVSFDAETFRLSIGRALGWNRIRSDLYEVRRSGDRFLFEGRGAGHGIGLCQDGAAAMGEKGESYRAILAFYYPGTQVSGGALSWAKLTGERADLETTQTTQDQSVLTVVERQMRMVEESTGLRFDQRPLVRVYPTVAAFRDNTGEPGWIAASTRGRAIRLQPAEILRGRGVLESTLRHELTHVLVESHAKAELPLWFSEGLVLWLTLPRAEPSASSNLTALNQALRNPKDEAELRRSYEQARGAVERLIRMYGKETVVGWIDKGLPRDLKH